MIKGMKWKEVRIRFLSMSKLKKARRYQMRQNTKKSFCRAGMEHPRCPKFQQEKPILTLHSDIGSRTVSRSTNLALFSFFHSKILQKHYIISSLVKRIFPNELLK